MKFHLLSRYAHHAKKLDTTNDPAAGRGAALVMSTALNASDHVRRRSSEDINGEIATNAFKKLKFKSINYDDFRPGALIKLRMENFVTYKVAEFDLSPSLNMIIGPNGSGKSTFVCAVCIGLAGKPRFIGRSSKLEDFIKNGEEKGLVEVTLKKPAEVEHSPIVKSHDQVIKITRHLSRSKRDSDYQINDIEVPESLVKSIISQLNIQLDNLCQFLSQERVASFAGQSPEKLLEETARSIDIKLCEVLSLLKELQDEERDHQNKVNSTQKRIDSLKNDCERLRITVSTFRAYQKKLKEIDEYKKLLPYVQLKALEEKLRQYRAEYEQAKTNLKTLLQEKRKLFETQKKFESTLKEANNKVHSIKAKFEKLSRESTRLTKDLKTMRTDIASKKQDIQRYREKIGGLRNNVAEKKKELEDKRVQLTSIEIPDNSLLDDLKTQHEELLARETRINRSLREVEGKMSNLKYERDNVQSRIRRQTEALHDNDRIHVLDELASKDRGGGKTFRTVKNAVLYVRSRQDMHGQVLEPPAITVSVKDPQHACYLTQCVDFNTRIAFTLTDSQAYMSFGKDILDRYGVNTRELNNGNPKPPLPREELKKMGFDFFLSDVVSGDSRVIRMLCQNCNIHSIPVSRRELSPEMISRLTQARRNGRLLFPKFIHGNRVVEMGIGTYSHKVWTRDYECIKRTDFFRADVMSDEQKVNIERDISRCQLKVEELSTEYKQLIEEKQSLEKTSSGCSRETESVRKRRNELNIKRSDYSKVKSRIRTLESEIRELNYNERETLEGQISQSEAQIATQTMSQTVATTELMEALAKLRDCQEELVFAEIGEFEARNMEASIIEIIASFEQREDECKNEFTNKKQKCREAKGVEWDRLKTQIRSYNEEVQERLEVFKQKLINEGNFNLSHVQDVISRLESEMATLDNDESSITILKQKEDELQKLASDIPQFSAALSDSQNEIKKNRQFLEPKLDSVVKNISDKFSDLFEEIGSRGHVALVKPDSFAEWKIEIRVAFRDNAQLSKLDARTQSGGERAVSTVLYMIALQQYTTAPFRIVDEINQGMDSHNERIVHKSMVINACAENTSQYFLITPKLLTGLYYHEKMMIHCVMAGPWIPNPSEYPDMVNFGKTSKYVL